MTARLKLGVLPCLAFSSLAFAQVELTAAQAREHIGETAKVCGLVASATYATHAKGAPTFLNLDKAYPSQIFTAVIWGDSRRKFGIPPEATQGTRICVTGRLSSYRGTAEIVVDDPSQITTR